MEISPQRLLVACGALFVGIVALNFAEQYRSNAQFKEKLVNIDFSGLRSRLRQEEGLASDAPSAEVLEQPTVWPKADLSELTSEEA